MGKFPTPKPEELREGFKCVIVFIPEDDNALFFADFLGQYTELIRPYVWEGSYQEKGIISQMWQEAYRRTMLWIESGNCADVIDEDGNMSINVTVNTECRSGSGGGDCTVNLLPYNPGSAICLPLETSPVSPPNVPPLLPNENGDGDGVGIPDPIYPNDPPYPGTDTEYNEERCEMAEFAFSYLRRYLEDFKLIDNAFLTVSAIVLFLMSSGTSAVIAMVTRLTAAQILAGAAALLEIMSVVALWDEWIDNAIAILDGKKHEFICGVYENLDTDAFVTSWASSLIQDIIADWETRPDWQERIAQPVLTFLSFVFASTPIAALARLNRVAAGFVPTFDCTVCDQGPPPISGFIWVPMRFTGLAGTGGNAENLTADISGNEFTVAYQMIRHPGADDRMFYDKQLAMTTAGYPADTEPVGLLYQTISAVEPNWRMRYFVGNCQRVEYYPSTESYGFAYDGVLGEEQAVGEFINWITLNNGRAIPVVHTCRYGHGIVNMNGNPGPTSITLRGWFLIPEI